MRARMIMDTYHKTILDKEMLPILATGVPSKSLWIGDVQDPIFPTQRTVCSHTLPDELINWAASPENFNVGS